MTMHFVTPTPYPFMRKTPLAPVSIVAAATSVRLWQLSTNRTARIVKLIAANRTGADVKLRIGIGTVGVSFTQVLPDITLTNGFDAEFTEGQIPAYWFGELALGDILVQSSAAAAAPLDVQVSAEIEEKGA